MRRGSGCGLWTVVDNLANDILRVGGLLTAQWWRYLGTLLKSSVDSLSF